MAEKTWNSVHDALRLSIFGFVVSALVSIVFWTLYNSRRAELLELGLSTMEQFDDPKLATLLRYTNWSMTAAGLFFIWIMYVGMRHLVRKAKVG